MILQKKRYIHKLWHALPCFRKIMEILVSLLLGNSSMHVNLLRPSFTLTQSGSYQNNWTLTPILFLHKSFFLLFYLTFHDDGDEATAEYIQPTTIQSTRYRSLLLESVRREEKRKIKEKQINKIKKIPLTFLPYFFSFNAAYFPSNDYFLLQNVKVNHDDDDSGMSVWWKVLKFLSCHFKNILEVVGWRAKERETQ